MFLGLFVGICSGFVWLGWRSSEDMLLYEYSISNSDAPRKA